jgi:hypothetical protein
VKPLFAAIALVILTASCATNSAPPRDGTSSTPVSSTSLPNTVTPRGELGEQRHEAGSVTVLGSWLAGATPAAKVTLDTHSVDLDGFDLKELARVRVDGGAWIAPTSWDAPKGGHHRAGTLGFGSLHPEAFASARLIELEVRDVAVPSHLLRWERAR